MSPQEAVDKLMADRELGPGYNLAWIDWEDAQVTMTAEWARIPGCESINHNRCWGQLWDCAECGKTVCYQEGADDEHVDLCDTCAVQKQQEVAS